MEDGEVVVHPCVDDGEGRFEDEEEDEEAAAAREQAEAMEEIGEVFDVDAGEQVEVVNLPQKLVDGWKVYYARVDVTTSKRMTDWVKTQQNMISIHEDHELKMPRAQLSNVDRLKLQEEWKQRKRKKI